MNSLRRIVEEDPGEDAVLLIAEATGGALRKIDVVAAHSLEEAAEGKSAIVDAAVGEKLRKHMLALHAATRKDRSALLAEVKAITGSKPEVEV